MTPATPKRTWPAVLFLAAAAWFAAVALLPVADQAWRAATVDAPLDPSLGAETARLLNDGGIVVQVRDGADAGAARIGREITAAGHPLRLDIVFDPQQAGEARLIASEAMSRGLGPRCIPEAIEPLVRHEAAGGDRTYLTSLGVEVVQAAYEADRFGKPVLPRWLVPGTAVLCGALAWLSRRIGRTRAPVRIYRPSASIEEDRRGLEAKLARIDADIGAARAALAERNPVVREAIGPDWWQRLNVVGQFRQRRKTVRAQTEAAALAAKMGDLLQARTVVEAEMSRNRSRLADDRRRHDEKSEDRAWMAGVYRQAVGILAIMAGTLAATHATVVTAYPGALISSARYDEMLFRSDTLIATALEGNPDLVGPVGAHCFARVVHPEPQEATVANAADQPQAEWPTIGSLPVFPPGGRGQACRIGVPCGHACIPAGRVCRIGQMARVGQECGKGYIAMAKTCRVSQTLPPPVSPASARIPEVSTAVTTPSTASYPHPDDAPRYFPPPVPVVAGEAGNTLTPPRTTVPSSLGQTPSPPRTVHVDGYTRSDGKQVQSYDRVAPGQGPGHGSRK